MPKTIKQTALSYPSYIRRMDVDALLDAGQIYTAMANGNWWQIRRNGQTRTWKRDAQRLAIPFKAGFKSYGKITESDFRLGGVLSPDLFRHADDLQESRR